MNPSDPSPSNGLDPDVRQKIDAMVRQKRVVLFMKGNAMFPACGFSAKALTLLRAAGAKEIATFDVLKDEALRQGIKVYSSWPTIPQCYIDGRFIGGSDILTELAERGELAALVAGG
jgi:monothiol glutaredoxin